MSFLSVSVPVPLPVGGPKKIFFGVSSSATSSVGGGGGPKNFFLPLFVFRFFPD